MISIICGMIMPRLKQKLLKALEGAGRVTILGIGSELRGDDAAGLLVLDYLRRKVGPHSLCGRSDPAGQGCPALPSEKLQRAARQVVKLFNGGTAPENLTGEIRRFQPGHLIMIDAVDMGKKPGTIALVDIKKVENTAFLTHKLPVKLMLDYLARMPLTTETNGRATSATRLGDLSAIALATEEALPASPERYARAGRRSLEPEGRSRVAAEMNFTTIFIGIQPRSLEFEGKISKPVIHASRELADLLTAALNASAGGPCFSGDKRRPNSRRRQ